MDLEMVYDAISLCYLDNVILTQNNNNNKTTVETQPGRVDVWTQKGKERVGRVERRAWKHTHHRLQDSQPAGCVGRHRECKPACWDNLEGWRGAEGRCKREATCAYLWPIHVDK